MNLQLLKARQTKYVAYATLYIVVVLAVVTAANVLSNRYNKSYDTTANKRYSLSEQTAKIIKGIKQDVKITYFDQGTRLERARDELQMYANLSPRVRVEYVDADKKPQLAREAGIKNYGATIVQVGTKKEEAKSTSEEDITGALIRATKGGARKVCFVTGSGEHQPDDTDRSGYSRLRDLLVKEEYDSRPISLLQKAEVPSDCTVLVVAGPKADYQQPAVDAIKKYVEEGGRALFLLDPPLKMGRSEIADNDALASLLQSWGVTVNRDLILDLNPLGQLVGLGPQVALVSSYASHNIVNDMKGTATGFPLVRSLTIKNGDKTSVDKLFDSSESSLATTKLNAPEVDPNDPKNKKGPFTIAAAGSYRTGKENSQGRFVVVGSSEWAANSFVNFNGNRDLAMNTINWLASDEDLISIRPKERDDRRISLTQAQLSWVRMTSQFLIPLTMLAAGIVVWWRRR
ncbi:MAG TPA: GldG family protein [Candidatus Angelobacter sp.]|nr:GldG family protein [Candidatus Angelobacter sp.]